MKNTATQRSQNTVRPRSSLCISPIAAACSTLLLATAVNAQQATLGAVTVTGIRKGIESAIAVKRDNDSIVEVISAEDIGKLPDSSIADSIARLPGVAAQRGEGGRASGISIRGLGPDYAGAVLNGREVVSSSSGRAAEYDQFPSELVNQVIVYKSPDASVMGQGLSGTIDIRPVSPLAFKGREMSVSVRGEQNSNGGNGNRVSASYIDQFGGGTVGLALGFAHLDSPGREQKYEVWRYGDYSQWGVDSKNVPKGAIFAQGFEASATTSSQKRDGVMAVLEVKPNKDFKSTVDLYYSNFKQDRVINQWTGDLALWGGGPAFSNIGTTLLDGNAVVSSGSAGAGKNIIDQKTFSRDDKVTSLGWRNELKLDSKWTGIADLGLSKATRDERAIESIVKAKTQGVISFSGLASSGGQGWSTTQNLTDTSLMQLSNDPNWANLQTPTWTDEIKTLRLSAKRSLEGGAFSALETGFNYAQRDKTAFKGDFELKLASDFVAIPANALTGTTNLNMGGINTNILSWDVPSIMGLYTQKPRNPWDAKDNNYAVHEKVTTAFAKLNIDTEAGSVPVRGNVGVQIVRTQQNSDGFAWNDGATPGAPGSGSVVPVSGGASYTDVLPSVNLAFSLSPDLMARVGLSKAMARPRMDDMRAGADQPKLKESANTPGVGLWEAGNGGKPDLQPWRAKALDFSLEKYFGKSSYVAAAAFYKSLDSFIYSQDTQRDFSGFPNYSTLIPGCPFTKPNCNPNIGTITTMDNGEGGKVWGLELAASLEGSLISPALRGFGVIASQAFTRNSLPLDKNGNTINLDGFSSNVNNLTLYYEKDGFSSRISRRYRAPFTSSTRSVQMSTETNVKYDAESQVDLQLGYSWEQGSLKGLSVLFQINNLTDPATANYKSSELGGANDKGLVPWRYMTYGRSALLGATYKF